MASPLDYLFGLWRSYQFTIWTPLPLEQAAVQLERSLVNPWWNTPLPGRLAGSVATGHFTFRHRGAGFSRQHPMINGQIVNAPGGGSYIVGELAYGTGDKVLGFMSTVILTALYGSCGISYISFFHFSLSSVLIAAVPCAGVPTICLATLSSITIRTFRYHKRLRAHLCSVLHGVDVTVQEK
jgi:hypothetical protein